MTLAELNALDRAQFTAALGWIFEESAWVADRAWAARPFSSRAHLRDTMRGIVESAARDEQLALLRAHPDLGTRLATSQASTREQAGVGFAALDDDARVRLQQLNEQYRMRFGFPFLYAVKGAAAPAILAALESRVGNDAEREFHEALAQVFRIAGFRLDDAVHEER